MNRYSIIYKTICIALLCLFSISLPAQKKNEKKPPIIIKTDSTATVLAKTQGAPIDPFRDTLFTIHGSVGSFTAEQRAKAIEEKIRNLEEYRFFKSDSLKLVEFNDQINLVYDDQKYNNSRIIVSIDTLQAQIYGQNKLELATSYRNAIVSAIEEQHYNSSWERIGIQVLCITLIVIGEYFLLKFLQLGYKRLKIFVRIQRHKKIKGFLGIIEAERKEQLIFILLKILRILFVLTTLYICLFLLFKLFPNTAYLADHLLDYVVSPLKKIGRSIVNYLPNLFTIIVIVVIFYYLKKFLGSISEKIGENKISIKGFYPDWAKPTYNIVSGILIVFMFILIFPYLPNSNSQAFQGVSMFVGLIISLGSTSLIGNLIAGLVITYMRPFKNGDRVKMDDTLGNIIEKTALVTRIKTAKNEIITIPNSSVMSSKTINYTASANQYGLILFITVAVGYEEPWRKVHDLLLKAALKTENTSRKQKPFIMQTALDDFYIEYQLNVCTRDANRMNDIYSDLRKNVLDVFNEAGVEILAPHYYKNVNIHDFNNPLNE